jgi:predicted dehydrogenase
MRNVFVMEAMWTRFFPAIQEVIAFVKAGRIGEIRRIETSFGYEAKFDPLSRIFHPDLGGGSLLDVGIYPLAISRMLMEETPHVLEGRGILTPTGVDESASWTLSYPSGAVSQGASAVVKNLPNQAIIFGTEGEIRIPQFWCPKEYSLNGETRTFEFPGRGFQFEADEVMNCLKFGLKESPLWSHSQTIHVMKQMDVIRKLIGVRYPQDL